MFIELHQNFRSHVKVRRLARRLGVSRNESRGLLVTLWLDVLEAAPHDGRLVGWSAEELAETCEWNGDTQVLTDALTDVGLLEIDADGVITVHDWCDYTVHLRKRLRDAARKRETYRQSLGDQPRTFSRHSPRSLRGESEEKSKTSAESPRSLRGECLDVSAEKAAEPEPIPEPKPIPDICNQDVQIGLEQLDHIACNEWHWQPLPIRQYPTASKLAPFTRAELDEAHATTLRSSSATANKLPYLLSVVSTIRERGAKEAESRAAAFELEREYEAEQAEAERRRAEALAELDAEWNIPDDTSAVVTEAQPVRSAAQEVKPWRKHSAAWSRGGHKQDV